MYELKSLEQIHHNSSGRLVWGGSKFSAHKGPNVISCPARGFSAGVYVLKVSMSDEENVCRTTGARTVVLANGK
jgi:hypothetical protein